MSSLPPRPLAQERVDWTALFAAIAIPNRSPFFANFGSHLPWISDVDDATTIAAVDQICERLASDLLAEFETEFGLNAQQSSGSSGVEIADFD
jgi:hypothetical protein